MHFVDLLGRKPAEFFGRETDLERLREMLNRGLRKQVRALLWREFFQRDKPLLKAPPMRQEGMSHGFNTPGYDIYRPLADRSMGLQLVTGRGGHDPAQRYDFGAFTRKGVPPDVKELNVPIDWTGAYEAEELSR